MEIFIVLSGFALVVAVYQIMAAILRVPSFKMSGYISTVRSLHKEQKKPFLFLSTLSKPLAKYVPVSMAKEVRLTRMLDRANVNETPKEYTARLVLTFLFVSIFALPFLFVSTWLALIPILAAAIVVLNITGETKEKSIKMQQLIENEIPGMVESITQKLEHQRNIIAIFDTYSQNYDTYLSHELKRTVADMRTGSAEVALQRFEMRMNNTIISQFVRGLIATMHGENMTIFFNELVAQVAAKRKQQLESMALKVKPKISTMSMIRAFWSIGVLLAIAMTGMMKMISF